MHPSVVTLGILRAGSAPNVLAETAFTHGTIRTYDARDRALLDDTGFTLTAEFRPCGVDDFAFYSTVAPQRDDLPRRGRR